MTTTPQPEALRLAELFEFEADPESLYRQAAALLRTQHAEIERLTEDLAFVERWANHHGAKPHTTAKEALSVIQHYPPIARITRGYVDGVVPDTFNPYAAIERKDALLRRILEAYEADDGVAMSFVTTDITKELQ